MIPNYSLPSDINDIKKFRVQETAPFCLVFVS